MKILHLSLKEKWFRMIASGEKKHEYRDIKSHWIKRLCFNNDRYCFRKFHIVRFTHGYAKNAPQMDIEITGLYVSRNGRKDWGASGDYQFMIELGKILSTKNFTHATE